MGIFESLSWREHLWVNTILVVLTLITIFINQYLTHTETGENNQRITDNYNTIHQATPSGIMDQVENGRNSQNF